MRSIHVRLETASKDGASVVLDGIHQSKLIQTNRIQTSMEFDIHTDYDEGVEVSLFILKTSRHYFCVGIRKMAPLLRRNP